MRVEIIGRDPAITMQICKMIGERAMKAQRKAAIIDRFKQAILFWR